MSQDLSKYLQPTEYFDFQNPSIQNYCEEFKEFNEQDQIIGLYLKIRDGFLYDPFNLDISEQGLKFSNVLLKKRAWCVEKAGLLISCARALGIPARPGYAIVKNHLENEKLEQILQSDLIVFHGYADLFLNGKWVKATPAFDQRVCRISGVAPLEFDGIHDSLFQEHDSSAHRFMEYVKYYGEFEDVPIDLMNSEMRQYYPHLFEARYQHAHFKFQYKK